MALFERPVDSTLIGTFLHNKIHCVYYPITEKTFSKSTMMMLAKSVGRKKQIHNWQCDSRYGHNALLFPRQEGSNVINAPASNLLRHIVCTGKK